LIDERTRKNKLHDLFMVASVIYMVKWAG